jgi:SPP1 gp7 family putative phage head morphogenesis protein
VKRILAPIRHRDAYTRAVTLEVMKYFNEVIFGPIVDMVEDAGIPTRENSPEDNPVARALKSGRIWYADGEFSGEFNAELARELRAMGATLDKTRGTFRLERLPIGIRDAAAVSLDRSRTLHQKLQDTLAQMQANAAGLSTGLDVHAAVEHIVGDLGKQFNSTVKAIDVVEVSAEMTPEIAKTLSQELTENLDLSIRNFVQEEIPKLRAQVQDNAFAGYRSDRLAEIIEARYGVTKRKAAFLADQETGLLVSKYREQRYRAVGSRSYKWSTSHDERVRADHRMLDQQIFSWDSPPVTNRATGARNNPGEDFRCRCVAMPVIELPE